MFHVGMGWVPWGDSDRIKHQAMAPQVDVSSLKLKQEKLLQAVNTYLNTVSVFEPGLAPSQALQELTQSLAPSLTTQLVPSDWAISPTHQLGGS